jgi:hypothetical protein
MSQASTVLTSLAAVLLGAISTAGCAGRGCGLPATRMYVLDFRNEAAEPVYVTVLVPSWKTSQESMVSLRLEPGNGVRQYLYAVPWSMQPTVRAGIAHDDRISRDRELEMSHGYDSLGQAERNPDRFVFSSGGEALRVRRVMPDTPAAGTQP